MTRAFVAALEVVALILVINTMLEYSHRFHHCTCVDEGSHPIAGVLEEPPPPAAPAEWVEPAKLMSFLADEMERGFELEKHFTVAGLTFSYYDGSQPTSPGEFMVNPVDQFGEPSGKSCFFRGSSAYAPMVRLFESMPVRYQYSDKFERSVPLRYEWQKIGTFCADFGYYFIPDPQAYRKNNRLFMYEGLRSCHGSLYLLLAKLRPWHPKYCQVNAEFESLLRWRISLIERDMDIVSPFGDNLERDTWLKLSDVLLRLQRQLRKMNVCGGE